MYAAELSLTLSYNYDYKNIFGQFKYYYIKEYCALHNKMVFGKIINVNSVYLNWCIRSFEFKQLHCYVEII